MTWKYVLIRGSGLNFLLRKAPEIRGRLRSLYGEDATDISSVGLWVRRFNSGEKNSGNRSCSASAKRFKLPENSFAYNSKKKKSIYNEAEFVTK